MRPELKDKIGLAGSDTGVTVVGTMLKLKGEEYIKKLKTQNPAVHNVSGRALLDMVIPGEIGVSPTIFRNHVEVSLKAGAPIEWIPMGWFRLTPDRRQFRLMPAPTCGSTHGGFHSR